MDVDFRFKLTVVVTEIILLLLSDDETRFLSSGEVEELVVPLLGSLGERIGRIRIHGYVERIVPSYDDDTFRRHFRMTGQTSNIILEAIEKHLRVNDVGSHPGLLSVSTD
jgi:hypothetical protein